MHLVEYNNYQIQPTEEALLIKPIRELYNADKSKTKDKFYTQLSILYFLVDPRSSYNYILEDDERLKEIIRQEGLPKDFKIDKRLQAAIDEYKKHVITASYLLLQDNKYVLQNMRTALRSIKFDDGMDDKDKATAIKTVASITAMIPDIVKKIADAEKAVTKEIEEQGRARGGSESKSLFDDGIELG